MRPLALAALLAVLSLGANCERRPQPVPTPPPTAPPAPTPTPTEPPVPPPPAPDAGPSTPDASAGGDLCENAYRNALEAGCPPDAPSNGTWVEACRAAESIGFDTQADCLLSAANCLAVETCLARAR